MNDTTAQFEHSNSISWVGLPPLEIFHCGVPDWVQELFQQQPASAATAGQSDDYLILAWPADFPLQELAFPTHLGRHTQRAVIATCLDTTPSGFDIHFRYFAPQYSSVEDAATGSAMRVLADYWQPQRGDSLRAWQCSPQGGELLSRREPEITWVGGHMLCENGEGADEES
ncbi:PhzF family phenazine biosynthesis protein [Candidatus Litorirhabdus singularis]|nr:PhzF family phenazine biosynthesis protein [Candidatus Litorirhabdus singularis]